MFRLLARISETPSETPAKHLTVPADTPCETLPAIVEDDDPDPVAGGSRFDWTNPELVTLHGTPDIAVYANPFGQIVIRGNASDDMCRHSGDDNIIVVNPRDVWILIDALRALADTLRANREAEE